MSLDRCRRVLFIETQALFADVDPGQCRRLEAAQVASAAIAESARAHASSTWRVPDRQMVPVAYLIASAKNEIALPRPATHFNPGSTQGRLMGGGWLKGASEFSALGDLLTEEQWQGMKPKKSP